VGKLVLGFAGGYAEEEGIKSGSRYFLLDYAHQFGALGGLGVKSYVVFCVVAMGAICWWAWKWAMVEVVPDKCRFPSGMTNKEAVPAYLRAAMGLGVAMMLLFSPHYPWYVAWLVPFLVLIPNLSLLTYLMAFFYLFTTALADGTDANMLIVNKILYGVTLLAAVVGWAMRRWNVARYFVSSERKPYDAIPRRMA
jgi:hypothetical protein